MPIYEFKCKACGTIFEYLCLRSDDKQHVVCPSCGHGEAEPLLSTFSSKESTAAATCSPSRGFS